MFKLAADGAGRVNYMRLTSELGLNKNSLSLISNAHQFLHKVHKLKVGCSVIQRCVCAEQGTQSNASLHGDFGVEDREIFS